MYPSNFRFNGVVWKSSEALFQAMRFEDQSFIDEIREAKNGFVAKLVAKKHKQKMVIEPRSNKDVDNMAFCLNIKIVSTPWILDELLNTGDAIIIEDVTSIMRRNNPSDLFWG